jgi:CubicO group peptidase (beta-lactamase class C family)
MNKYFVIMLLALLFVSCMSENPIKNNFQTYEPKNINDGWAISTPEDVGINRDSLNSVFRDFHEDESFWMVRSLTVFRKNKLIAETFTRDENDRTNPRGFWSCTKQVMGVLVGIAIDKGVIGSINDRISTYLPELTAKNPDKANISIKDLLTMTSGIAFNNYGIGSDDMAVLQEIPNSFLEYAFEKPMDYVPGDQFVYKDSDPMILSGIIQNKTGKATDLWADDVLFRKIGLANYEWRRYKDGITIGSYGLITTPREISKVAQLVLNGGTWNGEQLISKEWLSQMVSPKAETNDEKRFGYLWWSYPEYKTYFMSGNGRQIIFVFPEKELIVAITSEPKLQGKYQLTTPKGREIAMRIYNACKF